MLDSIISVKKFEEIIGYKKEGAPIKLHIEAVVNGKMIYQETTNCYISYDSGYEQYTVSIGWDIPDEVMLNLGLHGSYNTNFQTMTVENNSLIIKDSCYQISLCKE